MRPVVCFITASVDGFIAEPGGGMGWLDVASHAETDFGYAQFYASIDTMLMGGATYEFLLGAAEGFPHADREVFVFTQRDLPAAAPSVTLVAADAATFTARLRETEGGRIWLVGGGQINAALLGADLIDELRLFVQPVLLGDGVPLFAAPGARLNLALDSVTEWPRGVVELRYQRAGE